MDQLRKVYVEPTNDCNLRCRTCVRNVWDEPAGCMEWATFEALLRNLESFPDVETIAFAGIGEPLLHPRFAEMVGAARSRGLRTEVTTNALLLTESLARQLLDAGLDQLVVSIDGASAEAFGDVRAGASLDRVIENVRSFLFLSEPNPLPPVRIGIEFVAMRSNVHELPRLDRVARRIGASFIIVSNVLPYTAGLQAETLYNLRATSFQSQGSPWSPMWSLPRMDLTEATREPLMDLFRTQANLSLLDMDLAGRNSYCPFVQAGALAVAWHGGVSPCPPLLHSYRCYVMGRPKQILRHVVGQIGERTLQEIWDEPAYAGFRERVRSFDFPPCTDCGCDFSDRNEEDCYGNPFPVCGDCLWARGILRCA